MKLITLREITNICRLCLCEEKSLLLPAWKVFSSSLTPDDIERFTGILIPTDDNIPYVICGDCRNALTNSVAFRKSCLRNDRLYSQLFSEFIANATAEWNGDGKRPQRRTQLRSRLNNDDTVLEEHPHEGLEEDEVTTDVNTQTINTSSEEITIPFTEDETESDDSLSVNERNVEQPLKFVPPTNDESSLDNRSPEPDDAAVTQQHDISDLIDWPFLPRQLCDICGQIVTNIKRHLVSHTKVAKFACPHCGKKMTDSSNLLRHVQGVHLKTIIKTCAICGTGFRQYNSYNSHMRSKHNVGEKYECKICFRKFNHPGGVKQHFNRVHNYETKFECTTCSKRFKTKKALSLHGRVHSSDQPYACSQCPKRFKSSYARNTHQLTHSGIAFSCKLCDKSYRYKSLLSMHIRKFHPEEDTGNVEELDVV
uniref:Protein krueppel n=1 Tax=Anopheles dirus TaxID=7168 RepID=A0A182NPL2_9DIPT